MMAVKSHFRIMADPVKCVGCALCQLRCSFRFTKAFGLSEAKIDIDWNETVYNYSISFSDGCDSCGLCVKYCVYGALTAERVGKKES